MLYIALALVICAIIFSYKPPSFTINRTYYVHPTSTPHSEPQELPEDIEQKATYDQITQAFNEIFHTIGGDDDSIA